jgi:hypothetical protein
VNLLGNPTGSIKLFGHAEYPAASAGARTGSDLPPLRRHGPDPFGYWAALLCSQDSWERYGRAR